MKHVVSVSIGSSSRDHQAEVDFLGERIFIERRGTDGDINKAIQLIKELDGKVDAFGMGGIDLYIWAGTKRYVFRDAKKIARSAKLSPIVDGSGLKNTLERKVIMDLSDQFPELFYQKKVLMVSAMDRFGMAEALLKTGCETLYGDLIFALGVDIPVYSLDVLHKYLARWAAPIVVQLPFKLLYPTGKKQENIQAKSKYAKYYHWADIIAGDFHMINRHLPKELSGKTIITNTVTEADVEALRSKGISKLITTTPEIQGRSFGTNVIEGLMVAMLGKPLEQIKSQDFLDLLEKMQIKPRILELN
ncbi:MAG: quinate 5-dehydrogenase [Firmicutes bacterium]|nr:quinate 5-dehydrogenase [Bacillota bacterium]